MRESNKAVINILNYNDWNTCQRLIDKICHYHIFQKIVIIDNCSTDDSYRMLKECNQNNSNVEIILAPTNGGYAKGNNIGVRYSIEKYKPDILFVANPDILFEEEAANGMIRWLNQMKECGVVAPLVSQGYNVWRQPGFWGIIEELLLVTFNLDKRMIKKRLLKRKAPQEVGVVEGSFFAIQTDAYIKIGGFDEGTFLYCEENILGFRLKKAGYKTYVLPKISYEHLHSQSIKKAYKSKRKAFVNFYVSFKYYLENYIKVNRFQKAIFELTYKFGYFERAVFDIIKNRN